MAFITKKERKWGDRRDGCWVRDIPGLNAVMPFLFPNRSDCEVYLHQEIDITDLLRYLEEKNASRPDSKFTLFHCMVTMIARVLNERPKMNRFIQGGRTYERDEITISFVAKRKFTDHSEESLMVYKAKGEDSLTTIGQKILGEVREMRNQEATDGIDKVVDNFAKMPRPLLWLSLRIVRCLDYWGKVPKILTTGDTNYTSVLLSNLGSIKCPSVYHHLNNYGTNSVMITIGAMHKAPAVLPDSTVAVRDFVDIGATLDERIADGFYFARSLKLINHICAHPQLLDLPLEENSGYDYK